MAMTQKQVMESEWGQQAAMDFGCEESFKIAVRAIASGKPVEIIVDSASNGMSLTIYQKGSGDFIDEDGCYGDEFDEMRCVNNAVKFCNQFGLDYTIVRRDDGD